ncbi:MAG: lipoyl(octanoyl) transferase LipB [Cardiobacteriaceae bacterium]|nr:lipoyl(octanoyl) transferase LipB [Cardiobacteriaceae bacterium]
MSEKEKNQVIIRELGLCDYLEIFQKMKDFVKNRTTSDADELWLLEHKSVFTQGIAGKAEHLLNTGDIPVIQIDRGGQVTYHGEGQAVIYLLLDIKSRDIGVRPLVSLLENTTIELLAEFGIKAKSRPDAPGVYIEDGRKIASLGLKISRGYSYHGIAINNNLDLEPFSRINPCGLVGMQMAKVAEFYQISTMELARKWAERFIKKWEEG